MQDFDEKGILELLKDTGSIIEKYDAIYHETGENFNIFEVAGIDTKEVIVCRVLSELLSPTGRHGQEGVYLEIFLRDCLGVYLHDCLGRDPNKDEINAATISTELNIDEGRIDIVIEVSGIIIPIEAKINAKDRWRQCHNYYEFARRKLEHKAKIVYLTLHGDAPSKDSAGDTNLDNIITISFVKDILSWLEKCLSLPETIRKAPIREILLQFISSIKKNTNQLEDKPMSEIIQLLSASSVNMKNAEAIAQNIDICRINKLREFFEAVEAKMKEQKYPEPIYCDYNEKTKNQFPSINYLLKIFENDSGLRIEAWVRLEIDINGSPYVGICIAVDGENKSTNLERYKTFLPEKFLHKHKEWWVSGKYTPDGNAKSSPDFKNINDAYCRLFDKSGFDSFVDSAVGEIENYLRTWGE